MVDFTMSHDLSVLWVSASHKGKRPGEGRIHAWLAGFAQQEGLMTAEPHLVPINDDKPQQPADTVASAPRTRQRDRRAIGE